MIDMAEYRMAESLAQQSISTWRLGQVFLPHVFEKVGFPNRMHTLAELSQITDSMHGNRFEHHAEELRGAPKEYNSLMVNALIEFCHFYRRMFRTDSVPLPLAAMIAHLNIYTKVIGCNPKAGRILEIGSGCGYLSFFLAGHEQLTDYSQIEVSEAFYLLQHAVNDHIFGDSFVDHAKILKTKEHHSVFPTGLSAEFFEHRVAVPTETRANLYPWWRIGDVAEKKYDIITSNANMTEFSREAFTQYINLIDRCLVDDGALVVQCFGGGSTFHPLSEALNEMRNAGLAPVAFVRANERFGIKTFCNDNGVFVKKGHPLYRANANFRYDRALFDTKDEMTRRMYLYPSDEIFSVEQILKDVQDGLRRNSGITTGSPTEGGKRLWGFGPFSR